MSRAGVVRKCGRAESIFAFRAYGTGRFNAGRGADLAERINTTEALGAGDLVEIDPHNASGEAESKYERSRHILEERLGPGHPNVATSLIGSGQLHLLRGDLVRAEADLLRAIAIREVALGTTNHLLVEPLGSHAEVLRQSGRARQAAQVEGRIAALE